MEKTFAILIDSDNISAQHIPYIIDEINNYGSITYRRMYGDFTSSQMNKWKKVVSEYSLTPIQQFQNTTGKNATDSALIIDAMDILYTGNVQGFCDRHDRHRQRGSYDHGEECAGVPYLA